MLARTLMSAAALSIPEHMHAALLLVLSKLERGELVHGRPLDTYGEETQIPNTFNMVTWDCGSAHCILGWARVLAEDNRNTHLRRLWSETVKFNPGLYKLCYPNVPCDINKITTDQAAFALRNYLATGNPDWASVLP